MELKVGISEIVQVVDENPDVLVGGEAGSIGNAGPRFIPLDGDAAVAVVQGGGKVVEVPVSGVDDVETVHVGAVGDKRHGVYRVAGVGSDVLVVLELEVGFFAVMSFQPCAEERYCRPAPCCNRSPQRQVSQVHNSIFPYKKNAAGTSCGSDKRK